MTKEDHNTPISGQASRYYLLSGTLPDLYLKDDLFNKLSDKDVTRTTSVDQDTEHKHTHICESNGEHNHDTTNWDDETAPPSISMVPFIKY